MTHCKRGLVAGILFLAVVLTPVAAVAGPLEDGMDAHKSGDDATAFRLWRPLTELNLLGAALHFQAIMYENGHGVPQDYAEAVKWYRLAAEQDYVFAQHYLGVMYLEGLGVPPDDVQALLWFNLAASRFAPGERHDRAVEGRDLVAERMTPAQIAEAQKLARQWWKRRKQYE